MHIPEERSFTPAPSGAHRAICVGFIDLGTQKGEYMGQTTTKRLVQLRWELCDEQMEDGKPFLVAKRYTWSMNEKANLRKDLESWRGKPFEKADFGPGGFDTRKLIGVPALVTITHQEKTSGTFANVTAVSPLPKSMPKPDKPVGATTYFALEKDRFDRDVFKSLSEKMQETITHSPEYREIVTGVPQTQQTDDGGHPDLDDEIPF
jgi:hypothetical protein